MEIETLGTTDINVLLDCMNESFSDYVIPFHLTMELFNEFISGRRVDLKLSLGAFENGKLIAFVLTGFDEKNGKKRSYNAGTGVIPACRGRRIIRELYGSLIPVLQNEGAGSNVLEVISINEKAIRLYRSLGYEDARTLLSYKGAVDIKSTTPSYKVMELNGLNWPLMRSFRDWDPSWQHDASAVEKLGPALRSIGIYNESGLIGYLVYSPSAKRVFQFAVHKEHRKKGVATALFGFIAVNYSEEMSIVNVDAASKSTDSFLRSIGLTHFLTQHEMLLDWEKHPAG